MDVLISRQAAIENAFEVNTKDYGRIEVVGVDAILELPSAEPEPHWIPCSERLPEENSDILVTYVEKDDIRIVPVNYGCGTWFDCFFDKVLNQVGVLAWMPLPEPYKEDQCNGCGYLGESCVGEGCGKLTERKDGEADEAE